MIRTHAIDLVNVGSQNQSSQRKIRITNGFTRSRRQRVYRSIDHSGGSVILNVIWSVCLLNNHDMPSEIEMRVIEDRSPDARWYVHDGFLGWAYGSPLDPTPITRECACRILDWMIENKHSDALQKLAAFPNALDYADENDVLYERTGGNRLIAFVTPETCVFERKQKPEQDFEF